MRACFSVLILSLIGGLLAGDSKPVTVPEASKTFDCARPDGYSVVEVRNAEANFVYIVEGGNVLWSIRLPTGIERNGFGFNWAKKTKEGFEISVEYGSRYYYAKRFNFICKQRRLYLNEIIVDSFDKADPEKWNTKIITVKPNLPLEKFLITDFMHKPRVVTSTLPLQLLSSGLMS